MAFVYSAAGCTPDLTKTSPPPPPGARFVSTTAISISDALEECLPGRCRQGETDPDKFPPYNLGTGYTCDKVRLDTYRDCMQGHTSQAWIDHCTKKADEARDACKKDPCPHVYDQCIAGRCKRSMNSWDCWRRNGTTLEFGYWDWVDGEWTFIAVTGDEVPEGTWTTRCEGVRDRCKAGIDADPGDTVPPVDRSFCSADCYGDNCHHAAERVCKCLKEKTGGVADPRVIVFDGGATNCPDPVGNLYHSVLSIRHPTDPTKRCIIESQRKCNPDAVVEEACCYKDLDEYKKLADAGCSLAFTGPKKKPRTLYPFSTYSCEDFLEKRGTCAAEVPDTPIGDPDAATGDDGASGDSGAGGDAGASAGDAGATPSPVDDAAVADADEPPPPDAGADDADACPDAGDQPCAMACGPGGLGPATSSTFSACPSGTTCTLPSMITCPATCESCDAGSCPLPLTEPTLYRGTCVPSGDAGPDTGSPDATDAAGADASVADSSADVGNADAGSADTGSADAGVDMTADANGDLAPSAPDLAFWFTE